VELQNIIRGLPESYPRLVSEEQAEAWLQVLDNELRGFSRTLLEGVLGQVPSLVGMAIYLVLVPLSVFFFLKDKDLLMGMVTSLLPSERPLLNRVGIEMNEQLANYVRGKFIEIVIVGAVTYVTFVILGLNYAALLALLVGLSVLIPFIGAAVVTIPVAMVGYLQWGWSPEFVYLMLAYLTIQALDGNVLVPLLFSEAVDLHPVAIIVAVLAFGGLWGFWGVFFAIPLATLIKAVVNAWPRESEVAAVQAAAAAEALADAEARAIMEMEARPAEELAER
jgi:putative permease